MHCVIIGLGTAAPESALLADYENPDGEPTFLQVAEINPYLVEGTFVALPNRSQPVSDAPPVNYGSFALDDGNYTLNEQERAELLAHAPEADAWLRPFVGGQELLHSQRRWCLWLKEASPSALKNCPPILERVERVREWRAASNRETTRKLAATPTVFAEIRQPDSSYVAVPTVSSEKRPYIPMAFLQPQTVASNQLYVLGDAKLWHFGVLHSNMHMAWIRAVCGRLESRYRYSAGIVYNNFPWPVSPSDKQREAIEAAAQAVLDARAAFPDSTLADLYDPTTMPPALVKAHQALDRAVDAAYGKRRFNTDAERVALLFERYQQLISLPVAKPARPRRRKTPVTAPE